MHGGAVRGVCPGVAKVTFLEPQQPCHMHGRTVFQQFEFNARS